VQTVGGGEEIAAGEMSFHEEIFDWRLLIGD
jgi:hypothetical protein